MSGRGLILAGAALALALGALAQVPPAPSPTHLAGMGDPAEPADEPKCRSCHRYTQTEAGEVFEEHRFTLLIYDQCMQHHHTASSIGRSHPVGIDPALSEAVGEVPPELPLEGGQVFEEDYTMSCGTCHQPHMERLSEIKVSMRDEPVEYVGETPLYKTYYLRMIGSGLGPGTLCRACHTDF